MTTGPATTRLLRRGRPGYPALLAAIHDPPARLWVRGDADAALLEQRSVAIVGARACSSYGRSVARSLGRELSAAGVVVVSGMARGIDAEAHRGALEGGAPTVAVLGCGIDRDYPAAHAELARRIVAAGGLVVSEYDAGTEPAPWRFPARNRVIAGLTRLTVVVEARERSGALITADLALEQGREVMAVPGEITSALSAGSNGLLRQGAAPVTRVLDVFEALGLDPAEPEPGGPDATLDPITALLADGSLSIDALARALGRDPSDVAASLVALELAGRVCEDDGEYRLAVTR